jgi:hypothetical protein
MRITQDLRAEVVADGFKEKAAAFRASGQELYLAPSAPPPIEPLPTEPLPMEPLPMEPLIEGYSEDIDRSDIG